VNVELGSADGSADRVVVNGTDGKDHVRIAGDPAGVRVDGLAATVRVLHAEPANDRLEIETGGGDDRVSARHLAPGTIQLFVDGLLFP
jgi:hypothetical protein